VRAILGCLEAIDRAQATGLRHAKDPEVAGVALDAVRYRLHVAGELVGSLSAELREDRPAVPWSDLARLGELIGNDDDLIGNDDDLIGNDDELSGPQRLQATIAEPVTRLRSACQSILGESVRAGEDEPDDLP